MSPVHYNVGISKTKKTVYHVNMLKKWFERESKENSKTFWLILMLFQVRSKRKMTLFRISFQHSNKLNQRMISPWINEIRCKDVNFRELNKITVFDPRPVLRMDDILIKLGKAIYISTLDLTYRQVPFDEDRNVKLRLWLH